MIEPATEPAPPKLTLATPAQFDLSTFLPQLRAVLDRVPVSCVRLSLATRDEDALTGAADCLRAELHPRDIPLLIDDHYRLAERLGLDGVHLTDEARKVREARRILGKDAIVGAFCGTSKHAGMTAGEMGADYVAFGPVSMPPHLGDGVVVDPELFAWWAEMIEIPVIAEGGLSEAALATIAPTVDFVCLSDELWAAEESPAEAAARLGAYL